MVSKRAQQVDTSGIRKVFALAGSLRDPIDLSIGQPDFAAIESLCEKTKEAIDSGKNKYVPTQGVPELRERLRDELSLPHGFDICITSGVSGALTLCYLSLLDVGDEILIPDPYFVVYKELATLLGIHAVYYDTYPDFQATVERIEEAITKKTRAVIVNSPGNPTGVCTSQSSLDAIQSLCAARGVYLIYDEIYDAFCYDADHARLGQVSGLCATDVVVNGFSKTYGVPGWRLGYVIAEAGLIERFSTVQQYTFVCANSAAQYGLAEMDSPDFSSLRASYAERRDFLCSALSGHYDFVTPGGAYYLFPNAPGGDGLAFVKKCIEHELLVVPGSAFSTRNSHFRISFSAPMTQLERGVEILLKLAR